MFLVWAVVLYANHDPDPPTTLTAAILAVLSCATLGTIGWGGVELLDRRAASRTARLEAALTAAVEAAKPVVVLPVPSSRLVVAGEGINPAVVRAVRKLRLRLRETDQRVRH
jgi:hypothetical protein